MKKSMEKITNLCKSRGIIYPGSEIYGGMGNTWDYGPLGVEIKNNIKKTWWHRFVQMSDNSYGLDAAILMNSRVWEASGHASSFSDPKMDCKICKTRHRADNIIENYCDKKHIDITVDTMTNAEMESFISEHNIPCPHCGSHDFTAIREFKLMFETHRGVTEDNTDLIYLRPETAQGEFVNFLNVQRTTRAKVPFGIGQVGKAFRNEITPGNFIFRTIEFEQMEHQWFCREGDDAKYYEEYKQKALDYLLDIGLSMENLKYKPHDKLAHYAKAACDIIYNFPMGWSELNGIHNRTDFDLSRHSEYSGKSMLYTDPHTGEKYTPYVIEYSIGADRLMLAVLSEAYTEETLEDGEVRTLMRLSPRLAPYKVAILPLQKNLSDKAKQILNMLKPYFMCTYDEAGSIGKRYRRQDEIGTPMCITVDFDTLENDTVTVRDRDDMSQVRMHIDELIPFIEDIVRI